MKVGDEGGEMLVMNGVRREAGRRGAGSDDPVTLALFTRCLRNQGCLLLATS